MILIIIKFCELLLRISPRIINSLRSYIKHSIKCFLLFPNASKLVKKLGCASFFQPTSRCLEIGCVDMLSAAGLKHTLDGIKKSISLRH